MARRLTRRRNPESAPGVALVTGGARRLGRELALGFARAGFAVGISFRTEKAKADETVRYLRAVGGEAAAFRADLAGRGAPARLVESVAARFGRLDVLVHAASPWITSPVADVTLDDWEAVFRAGPRAAFFLAQAAAPALARAEGSILLISDVAATKAWPHHVPHATAKAAIDALVRNLAVALGPAVRVNGLAPGIVLPPDDLAPSAVERLVAGTPLKRKVEVSDLVSMAVALAANRSMTGQVVAVDAGRSCV
jgi:pteridine reductase